jgi:hypothetical protein
VVPLDDVQTVDLGRNCKWIMCNTIAAFKAARRAGAKQTTENPALNQPGAVRSLTITNHQNKSTYLFQ